MPIDIQKEQVVTLTEATRILPRVNGKGPAICTLWRWCRKGLRGVNRHRSLRTQIVPQARSC